MPRLAPRWGWHHRPATAVWTPPVWPGPPPPPASYRLVASVGRLRLVGRAARLTYTIPTPLAYVLLADSSGRGRGEYVRGANGEVILLTPLTELTEVESGVQAQETTFIIPAGSLVMAAPRLVTVQPGGTATMTLRGAFSDHEFGEETVTDATTVEAGTVGCPFVTAVAEPLRYVFDAETTDALGRIRCTVFYYAITPPTS